MIFGDDFSQLQKVADQVALKLRAVEGAADVRVEQISGLPTLNVAIDHVAAAQYGLTAADVIAASTWWCAWTMPRATIRTSWLRCRSLRRRDW
ncbi:hypothetical protein G6F35_018611 [Rhizopus arrhizus]|nr:hypothetical protein G6F35_018611 [Rhizopus arrhizus]